MATAVGKDVVMMIRVMHQKGTYDMLKTGRLDSFIESEEIIGFLRADGWVTIGKDPVRRSRSLHSYDGPERRMAARQAT
jgi:hypothetical protein